MTDEKSLDDIMSAKDETASTADQPAQDQEQPRGPDGKFATKQTGQEQPAQQQPDPQAQQQQEPAQQQTPPGFIPIQALDERLAKRDEKYTELERNYQTLQRQLASLQQPKQEPPKPAPDFFENPDEAFRHRLNEALEPLQQADQKVIERFSRMMAVKDYTAPVVDAAYKELERRVNENPQANYPLYLRIMRAEHPYGELVTWHKEQSALTKFGADPEEYINREIERRMAEKANGGNGQPQPQTQQPAATMPSSFTAASNQGPRSAPQWSGPKPLSEIMNR